MLLATNDWRRPHQKSEAGRLARRDCPCVFRSTFEREEGRREKVSHAPPLGRPTCQGWVAEKIHWFSSASILANLRHMVGLVAFFTSEWRKCSARTARDGASLPRSLRKSRASAGSSSTGRRCMHVLACEAGHSVRQHLSDFGPSYLVWLQVIYAGLSRSDSACLRFHPGLLPRHAVQHSERALVTL